MKIEYIGESKSELKKESNINNRDSHTPNLVYKMESGKPKYNFTDYNGELINDIWYDDANHFRDGLARVKKEGKWNFIDKHGIPISDIWFDSLGYFIENFATIQCKELSGHIKLQNYINKNGNVISDNWYRYCHEFSKNGTAVVEKNGKDGKIKYNLINKDGEEILQDDFEAIYYSNTEYVKIKNSEGEYNYTDTNGNIILKEWCDNLTKFEGMGVATYGNKNYIVRKGKPLTQIETKKGFDVIYVDKLSENKYCIGSRNALNHLSIDIVSSHGHILMDDLQHISSEDSYGFFIVRKDMKSNYINKDIKLLSEEWFESCEKFKNGYGKVSKKIGTNNYSSYNYIDKDGKYMYNNLWFKPLRLFRGRDEKCLSETIEWTDGTFSINIMRNTSEFPSRDILFYSEPKFPMELGAYAGIVANKEGKYNIVNIFGETKLDEWCDSIKYSTRKIMTVRETDNTLKTKIYNVKTSENWEDVELIEI